LLAYITHQTASGILPARRQVTAIDDLNSSDSACTKNKSQIQSSTKLFSLLETNPVRSPSAENSKCSREQGADVASTARNILRPKSQSKHCQRIVNCMQLLRLVRTRVCAINGTSRTRRCRPCCRPHTHLLLACWPLLSFAHS